MKRAKVLGVVFNLKMMILPKVRRLDFYNLAPSKRGSLKLSTSVSFRSLKNAFARRSSEIKQDEDEEKRKQQLLGKQYNQE
jgi:hypothetical protein